MNLGDRFEELENEAVPAPDLTQPDRPKGWEPGVVWDGTRGELTTDSVDGPPANWDDLLRERGLDPARYEVVGDSLRWCSYDGWKRDAPGEKAYSAMCFSYKAEVRLRKGHSNDTSLEQLYREARKAKAPKKTPGTGDSTLVVALSDFQLGNPDGGGTPAQIDALAALPDLILDRLAQLKRSGTQIGTVCVAGLGDLVEGTCGFYPSQEFRVELDRREQTRVVRRNVRDIIKAVSGRAEHVIATAVPGNHGENRKNGKAYTRPSDNDDVAVFEQVAEILRENPIYDNVGFRLPGDGIAISVELSGQTVSFTHGHVPKMRGTPVNTLWEWWKDQAHGRAYPHLAQASILVSGHYHHLNVKEQEGRLLLICPSLTNVGDYFADAKGVNTVPGTLTFVVTPDGWDDLKVLR